MGPWTPIKPGEPKFEPTKFNGVLRQRVKIHDARIEAKELGVDLSDVTEETYGIKQWQEIYKRMEAGRKAAESLRPRGRRKSPGELSPPAPPSSPSPSRGRRRHARRRPRRAPAPRCAHARSAEGGQRPPPR